MQQLLDRPSTVRTLAERRIGELLNLLRAPSALFAFVLVKRHSRSRLDLAELYEANALDGLNFVQRLQSGLRFGCILHIYLHYRQRLTLRHLGRARRTP